MVVSLVGIHCYLGIHVLKREVIFIDLSLAQLAALGYVVATFFHHEVGSIQAYFIALSFTFFGSLIFAFCKRAAHKISQEALIGVTYALGASVGILMLNNMSHGSEHIKEMLVGKLLWVELTDVLKVVIIYSLVGVFHFIYRKKFFALSCGERVENSVLWDFLFYALFGVVITSSVGSAGILLVFSLLIGPALITTTLFSKVNLQLIVGWLIGIIFCLIGMGASYKLDIPVGASIVALISFTVVLYTIYLALRSKTES